VPADARSALQCGRSPEHRIDVLAGNRDHFDDDRPTFGERAGLVEGHRIDRLRDSSASASLMRMPWPAATPVPR
jgi:hypothetical protein